MACLTDLHGNRELKKLKYISLHLYKVRSLYRYKSQFEKLRIKQTSVNQGSTVR